MQHRIYEQSDEVAYFVQGPLSIRSPGLQTLDSLTLLLINKLRIARVVVQLAGLSTYDSFL